MAQKHGGARRPAYWTGMLVVAAALAGMVGQPAVGQTANSGAMDGIVYDARGAVIPGARVLARNTETNAVNTMESDGHGGFRAPQLPPGAYSVVVEAPGFARYTAQSVLVELGRLTTLEARLVPGGPRETVEAKDQVPRISTEAADFSTVVNQTSIHDLPINGGRWSSFALLTPGVVSDANGFGLESFRGISTLLNNVSVDGADNNQAFFSEERGRTRAGYSTAQDAVEEFEVNTSNYSSEYGRAAGGVVNTVTKSGGSSLHGEAHFYDRDNQWGATNPFTVLDNVTTGFAPVPYKPKDWRKQAGASAGGPLLKDRVFFFYVYDYYKRNFPGTAVAGNPAAFFAQPSPDLPAGDTCNATAYKYVGKDASDNHAVTDVAVCTLWSNLVLESFAVASQRYVAGLAQLAGLLGPTPRTGEQQIHFPKLDWQVSERNHLGVEYNRMRWNSPAGIQTQATNTYGIRSFGNDHVKTDWGLVKLDTFLTENIVNQVRFHYGRDLESEFSQAPTTYEQQFANLPASATLGSAVLAPQISIGSSAGFSLGTPSFLERPAYPDERRKQVADTFTWARGSHTFKVGIDANFINDLSKNLRYQYGAFTYTGSTTPLAIAAFLSEAAKPGACAGPCYSSFTQAFGPVGFRFNTNDYAAFFQDDWKLTHRLTLNAGMRYEYEQLPHPFTELVNTDIPQTGTFPSDRNNFGPRFGIAYDIFGSGNTVLRAGYGIYYGRVINSTIYSALTSTGSKNGQVTYTIFPGYKRKDGPALPCVTFPVLLQGPPDCSGRGSGGAAVFFHPGFQNPQIHQAELTIDQHLGWKTVLSVSYLGSFGRELPGFRDVNIDTTQIAMKTYAVVDRSGKGPLQGTTYTSPFYTRRLSTSYGAVTSIFSGVNSSYNAVVLQLSHRMAGHVQFNANYTWSHALDYSQNGSTFTDTNDVLEPGRFRLEYANSNYDVPQRFVADAVVASPWRLHGWKGALANDLALSPIFQVQNGLPYSMTTSGTPAGGIGSSVNGSGGANRIAEIGRNTYRFPGTSVLDLRISKRWSVGERYEVECFGEAFNLLNHVNVTGVNNTGYTISGSTLTYSVDANEKPLFGTIQSANSNFAYSPRQVELGVRVKF